MSATNKIQNSLRVVLTLCVVGGLVVFVDPGAIGDAFRDAQWTLVVVAVALLPVNLMLDAWVWGVLLEPVTGRLSLSRLTAATLAGFAVGFFTPARIGEYAGRAFYLPDGDRWTLSATIFAQRMVDMAVALVVGAAAFVVALTLGVVPRTPAWIGVAVVGSLVATLWTTGTVAPHRVDALVRRLFPNVPSLHDRTAFLSKLSARQVVRITGGSALRYLVFGAQFALLGAALAPEATPGVLAVATGCTFFVKFLVPSVTLMDLGVREGAAVFFFDQFALAPAAGLNAALLLFAVNLVLPSALGLPFLWNLTFSSQPSTADANDASPLPTDASPVSNSTGRPAVEIHKPKSKIQN